MSAPDGAFPYWSADQADRFRALVHAAFAEAGTEVTIHVGHAVDAGNRRPGLGNIAAVCHNDGRGEGAWEELSAATCGASWPTSPKTVSRVSGIRNCVRPALSAAVRRACWRSGHRRVCPSSRPCADSAMWPDDRACG